MKVYGEGEGICGKYRREKRLEMNVGMVEDLEEGE